jgi:ATP phosphoribosyltransferase
MSLILAVPSKGRLKEQVEDWLADCGLPVRMIGGDRGYAARLDGLDDIQVRLLSAADIAEAIWSGEAHLGVTGEDLLRERGDDLAARALLLAPLGFGRADLVVAAPKSWIDVETMADVDEVAHLYLARTGRRLRVATKYLAQTRAFFARHHIADYRIVESGGATEGAPAAGAAELIVDITTTGATLEANALKILADGVILKSQAQLAASLAAEWGNGRLALAGRLMGILEGRARARSLTSLVWPAEQDAAARAAVAPFLARGAAQRANGLLAPSTDVFAVSARLAEAGIGPVTATQPTYVFEAESAAIRRLGEALAR